MAAHKEYKEGFAAVEYLSEFSVIRKMEKERMSKKKRILERKTYKEERRKEENN